ncbi:hypothetical protein [Parapedobacter tibetensis]|uniref:hypothetical protein n=1 Tax=Parapedobacter tibetensis TaxID=2972951 RepID=UPI00214D6545|nr:hypothetical protein [Parapedobacter tibetensis]
MMKYILFFIALVMVLIQACGQSPEYGKQPLVLDDFKFDLDIAHFFRDERIFRYTHDDFSVSSEEYRLDDDSLMTGFITYSTRSMSTSRPLASYAGVQFEDIGLVTDWEDEQVLMVYGGTSYGETEDIRKVIDGLKSEFNNQAIIEKGGFMRNETLYILFKGDRKVAKLAVNLPDVDTLVPDDLEDGSDAGQPLTPEIAAAIENQLREREEITFHLFVSTPEMDEVMKDLRGRSGFLVDYR